MAEFDPVPPEYLLSHEIAERFIPVKFVGSGDATARELALQILVDEEPDRQYEIKRFQQSGRRDVSNFFRFMFDTLEGGAGRHTEHMVAAACLYPVRDVLLNIGPATEDYLRAHGSQEHDYLMTGVLVGSLGLDAMMECDENEAKVRRGELYIAPSPLDD